MRTSNMKRILALTCSLVDPMFKVMDQLGGGNLQIKYACTPLIVMMHKQTFIVARDFAFP